MYRANMLRIVLLILGVASLGQGARSDATSEARKAIQAAYDKSDAATAKKDIDGAMAFQTSDYTYTTQKGRKLDNATVRTSTTQVLTLAREIHGKTVIRKIALKGSMATVTVDETGSIVVATPQRPDQVSKIVIEARSEDVWIKTPKGWREKSSRELSSKQSVNGKPVAAPTP